MNAAIRSEVLRAVSGLSVLAVYLVALLVPVFVLFSDGSRMEFEGVDAGTATARLLEPLAWSVIGAGFVAAYAVTREYYYGSIDRTLTVTGARRAFRAKLVAGVVISGALSVCVFAVWTVGVFIALRQNGLDFELTRSGWQLYAGALLGVVLGVVIGVSIGWTTRNYYVTTAVVMLFPMAVELALLRTAPELAKFSPGLAIAALGVPGYDDRLLEFVPALGVGLVWTAGLVALAWLTTRRRAE